MKKKLEYNIINLKHITYNSDILTNILTLKLRKRRKINYIKSMLNILNKTHLPKTNSIRERAFISDNNNNHFTQNDYRDSRIISNMKAYSLDNLLISNIKGKNINRKDIHKIIFNNIKYKNIAGIRLEIKGRLTKRYRADRSISSLK